MRKQVIAIAIAFSIFIFSLSPPVSGQTSELFSLEFNTPSETGLDIVFIPENYPLNEMDNFSATVEEYYQSLLSLEPFSDFRDWINVWRIDTTEDFGSRRDSSVDRLLTVNVSKVTQFVEGITDFDLDDVSPNDLVIVLVNDSVYGGSGAKDVVVTYTGRLGKEVMVHELGHSFGSLGDEYIVADQDYPAGFEIRYPNIDWDGSKWLDVPGTGAFLGAMYRNLVRPTYDGCIMRTVDHFGFCPVCERALVSILENYVINLTIIEHELTVSVNGSGSVYPTVGNHTYRESTDVAVTANASSGWTFDHWLLDSVNVGSTNPYIITIDANHQLTGVFIPMPDPTPTPTPNPTPTPTPTPTPSPATTPTPTASPGASSSPSATASPSPSPLPTSSPTQESSSPLTIAAVIVAIVVILATTLLVYFKKHKN